MKKILLFIGVVYIAFSCQEFDKTADFPEFVQWESISERIDENSATPVTIEVQLVGAHKSSATDITFEVFDTNVREGVDYSFPDGKTLSIGANESVATITIMVIDNPDFDENERSLKLELVSTSNNISVGDTTSQKKSVTIIIVEDDCPIPSLVGTFNVVTTETNPGGCSGVENTVTIVESGSNTYTISDITGGLYPNCYGSADNPGDIMVNGFAITMIDQPDVVYGGDIFNGTGVLDCDGSFTISWSNGFGDAGTSLYTK